jgi:hypothetical protein
MRKIIVTLLLPIIMAPSCGHDTSTPAPSACQGIGASDVVLLIKRFDVADAEIPVIYYACPNPALHITFDPNQGKVSFDGGAATLRFRLDSSLKRTQWKSKIEDSARMTEFFDQTHIPQPNRGDWCSTGPTNISVANRELSFPLCPDEKKKQHMYFYELHLDQTETDSDGNAATIDIAIDPQIIHRPSSVPGPQ